MTRDREAFRSYIETEVGFPKEGVVFHDFTPLHADAEAFGEAIEVLAGDLAGTQFDVVVGVEAKGFIVGTALATYYGLPLLLARKPGLTPGTVLQEEFVKEYGVGTYEMKAGGLSPGQRVLIVYDILAGPGATNAVATLVRRQGATPVAAAFIVELEYLGGRTELMVPQVVSLVKVVAS
jgi:adenine phosphoribosyltransferase